jgi:ketosteroid isomerase-like protein
MSEENIKAVRDAAEAFNRGDLDTWFGDVAEDIDYRRSRAHPMTTARSTARTPCAPTCRTGKTPSTTSRASRSS